MRLALVQMQMSASLDDNLEATVAYLRQAQAAEADLALFPELHLTPFFPAWERSATPYAEDLDAWCLDFGAPQLGILLGTSRMLGVGAAFTLWTRWPDGTPCETAFLVGPDGALLGEPARRSSVEGIDSFADYIEPCPRGHRVYETPWGTIGLVLGQDEHLADAVADCARQGAGLVLVPATRPGGTSLEDAAGNASQAARESGCYVALCSRSGTERTKDGERAFAGGSLVAAPTGEIVGQAGSEEGLFVAEIAFGDAQ